MLTYKNKKYYTKYEVLEILNYQKSENNTYQKHTYDIIINMVLNSKQKSYIINEGEELFYIFRQNLIKEVEKQYAEFFSVSSF